MSEIAVFLLNRKTHKHVFHQKKKKCHHNFRELLINVKYKLLAVMNFYFAKTMSLL